MSLGIGLRIDESYIAEENQRLRMYKNIAGVQSEGAIEDVRAELEDRYGPMPGSVRHLLDAALLRIECERIGVAQVDRKRDQLHMKFTENAGSRSGAADEAGGEKCQARRAVHSAGCVALSSSVTQAG